MNSRRFQAQGYKELFMACVRSYVPTKILRKILWRFPKKRHWNRVLRRQLRNALALQSTYVTLKVCMKFPNAELDNAT